MTPPLLSGRVAIVSGAARGIGAAIADRFASHGARVVLADMAGVDTSEAVERCRAHGADAVPIPCDVTDEADVARLFDEVENSLGPVGIAVNNAGFTRDATMKNMDVEDFDDVLTVHLRGPWLVSRRAAASMRGGDIPGSIINLSSISGKVGNFGQTNYSAAKAGVIGLTKSTARELARYGIRVNAIQPGLIRTPMTAAMPPDVLDAKVDDIPLGRVGEPEDVADVAVFLASDMARYMTGATLEVAGGRHM